MVWFLLLIFTSLCSLILFSQRFSSRTIINFPIVQFCYLFFSAPLISLSLIHIAYSIILRSPQNTTTFDWFVLSLFILSTIMGALGSGIHSVAVTLSTAMKEHTHLPVYQISESIHNELSHEMLYINQMLVSFFLILLEMNHPYSGRQLQQEMLIALGLILGFISGMAKIGRAHV